MAGAAGCDRARLRAVAVLRDGRCYNCRNRRNLCKIADIAELESLSRKDHLEIARNLWKIGNVERIWKLCRLCCQILNALPGGAGGSKCAAAPNRHRA